MKTKYTFFLKLIGSLFALALLAAPSLSTAFTITQIDVIVGGVHYCDTTTACGNQIWNLNGGVTLTDGQTLIVTQTGLFGAQPRGGENFDSSDRGGAPVLVTCSTNGGTKCTVQIYVNTGSGLQLVSDDSGDDNPLSAFNEEPTSDATTAQAFAYMEAAPWVRSQAPNFTFTGTNFTLDFGYADNVHGSACPDSNTDCFPQPVWCSTGGAIPVPCPAANFFLGQGVNPPLGNCGVSNPPTGVGHQPKDKNGDVVGCYDAGALRITAHPPHLTVVKTPDHGTFTSGSQLTYTVVVSNDGAAGSVAHNVKLNDALPGNGGLSWQTATTTQGTCTNPIVSNNLHCDLGDIAQGSSVTVTITSTATTPAAACQDQPNPAAIATDNEGDRAQDSGDQTCIPPPHLTISKSPTNGTFTQGSQLTYTIVVGNNGTGVAHSVMLTDALPGNGGLVWQTATTTQGSCVNPIAGNSLSCSLLDISPGGSVTITVKSTATTPAAACQDQPNPAAIATDNEGDRVQASGDQSCTPPNNLGHGDTATIGFWANKNGQGVITCENGGASSTALGSWLASTFPKLFGSNTGIANLTGATNTQVAAAFVNAKNGGAPKTTAQVFGAALAVYVTSSSTGTAGCVSKFGFNFGAGTGGKLYNVGSNGAAIGLTNNTSYTVLQLLQQANALWPWTSAQANAINNIFDGINSSGDIN